MRIYFSEHSEPLIHRHLAHSGPYSFLLLWSDFCRSLRHLTGEFLAHIRVILEAWPSFQSVVNSFRLSRLSWMCQTLFFDYYYFRISLSSDCPLCAVFGSVISILFHFGRFYVTFGLFMSLFVRLGHIISNFWVHKNLLYYWVGFSGHFLSFTLALVHL